MRKRENSIKKYIKSVIIILITAIICISGTAYAATVYFANEIAFTPSKENYENGFNVTNVEEALNSLYSLSNTDLINKLNLENKISYYMGNRQDGKNISIDLKKGNYLVFLVNSHSWASSEKFNNYGNAYYDKVSTNNGQCSLISGYYLEPTATNLTDTTKYVSQYTYSQIYKCSLSANSTIKFTTTDGTYNDCTQGVILQTIKIN